LKLQPEEIAMLRGERGEAARKAMEILVKLGEIYGAERLIPVRSVQVAGVSYLGLGEAGLDFLRELAPSARVCTTATLNPAGIDLEQWEHLGIDGAFARRQAEVLDLYGRMGLIPVYTCTPYLAGNLPLPGESIAWSESSAVCFANSVLGARTNREGGPSALASALTGRTPEYGMHLDADRQAKVLVEIADALSGEAEFGALGTAMAGAIGNRIPFVRAARAQERPTLDELKAFGAALATFGGQAMFFWEGVTPDECPVPRERISLGKEEIEEARRELSDGERADFVSVGCPHASIAQVRRIASLLEGKRVGVEFWITLSRSVKAICDRTGLSEIVEGAGAKMVCDTCAAVAPIRGRFTVMATESAKACYYARGTAGLKTQLLGLEACVREAVEGA
jgi:predicted aconitase